jgi:hypothetical protein
MSTSRAQRPASLDEISPSPVSGHNGRHRARKAARAFDRRKLDGGCAVAARRQEPVETEFQRGRIALERELDGLAGQGLGLTVEGVLHRPSRPVSRPARAPGGIAGPALFEGPSPLFLLFFHQIISHRYRRFRRNPGVPALHAQKNSGGVRCFPLFFAVIGYGDVNKRAKHSC